LVGTYVKTVTATAVATLFTLVGVYAMAKSGVIRKREDKL
jgi:hypothetical protein